MTDTRTTWLRTPDGKVRLNVLKQFYFTHRIEHVAGDVLRSEGRPQRFTLGEHLLDPKDSNDREVLDHPWIHADFADGAIESPEQTRAREAAEAAAEVERQAVSEAHRLAIQREADAAMERTKLAAQRQSTAGGAMASELDTPLDQLQRA